MICIAFNFLQEILNDQLKQNRSEFDWSNMEQNGIEDIKVSPV